MNIKIGILLALLLCAIQPLQSQCNPDFQSPVINCPSTAFPIYVDGNCQAPLPNFSNSITVTDNCDPNPTTFQSPAAGSATFGNGTSISVSFFAVDVSMNGATCTFTAIGVDSVAPTIMCPINQVLMADANCQAVLPDYTSGASASDNCSSTVNITQSPPAGTMVFGSGLSSVTLIAEDGTLNSASCTFGVDVTDNTPPIANCQNIDVFLDANGIASIVPADLDLGSTDACGLSGLSISTNSFSCSNLGQNTVTLSATDSSGNVGTCTSIVNVIDNTDPVAICQNNIVYLDDFGSGGVASGDVDGGSTDNCGITFFNIVPTTFDCSDLGNNQVAYLIEDASGNAANCVATIIVEDTTSPIAMCTPVTVFLDANGMASVDSSIVGAGSVDNCLQWSYSLSQSSFTAADLGSNSVVLTVTDPSGNTSTCTTTVDVQDTTMSGLADGLLDNINASFYPNPTEGIVLLRWEDANAYLGMEVNIRVSNTLGQMILEDSWVVESNLEEHTYDLDTTPTGTYFFELRFEGGRLLRKVLKK